MGITTSRDIDALKFFHEYMDTLVELGGENLPKAISLQMGSKLGGIYKNKGINGVEIGLKHSYEVLNGKSEVKKIDENTFECTTEYPKNFCPIGGEFNPDRADLVHQTICFPYTLGFLNEIDPANKYKGTVKECILKSNSNKCCYVLKREYKGNGH